MPSASDIRAGGAFLEMYTKNGPLYAGLKAAQRRISSFSTGIMSMGKRVMGLGAMITGPILASAKTFAYVGDNLDKMSGRTGIAVESLSELGFAAEQGGTDLGTFEGGVKRMQRSLTDAERGLSTPVEALDMLGLSVKDFAGLNPEQQFQKIADGITSIDDPTKKAAAAMMLFGRAGADLLPMLDGLADTRQQAKDLGLVVSEEDAKRAAKFTDQMNIMKRVLLDGVFSAGSAVADVLGEGIMQMVHIAKATADWIDQNRGLFVSLLKIGGIIAAAGAGLVAFGMAGMVLSGILGGIATAITVVGTVLGVVGSVLGFLVSPIGLVTVGLVALAGYFAYTSGAAGAAADWIMERFGGLLSFAQEIYGGIADAMAAGDLQLAAEVMWAGIQVAWTAGMAWIRGEWAELRFFLVETWGQVAFAILDTVNYLWSGMVDAFWSAADGIVDAWKWAEKIIARQVGWIIAKLGGLDPEAVMANLEQDYSREQAGRDSGRQDRDRQNQEAADTRYAAIEASRQDWTQGAEAKRQADAAAADDGLAEARERFAGAREAAKVARQAAEAAKKDGVDEPTPPDKPSFPGLAAGVDAGGLAKTASLFSADAYKMLAGADQDPAQQMRAKQLAALETIATNTEGDETTTIKEAVPPKR